MQIFLQISFYFSSTLIKSLQQSNENIELSDFEASVHVI